MAKIRAPKRSLAVIDLETDPFMHGRDPMPFAAGYHDGQRYMQFWGDDCVAQLIDFLQHACPPHVIYAHNGGKFDYWYMAHAISAPLKFIDSRLVTARLGQHELRDSYKILPVPLSAYHKDKIDYALMERSVREKHRAEISDYLRGDCLNLYELVARFREQFGDVLTIGGAAMREITKRYDLPKLNAAADAVFRPYFHGGRCEAFEIGKLRPRRGNWKAYDVNSMYPAVMAKCAHPIGQPDYVTDKLPRSGFYLATIDATSRGALPLRTKQGLSFPHAREIFNATSHEIIAAKKLGLLDIHKVVQCYAWTATTKFDAFVEFFMQQKIAAERIGDKAARIFAKLLMNNAYGKFAQNPERFKDYELFITAEKCEDAGYEIAGTLHDRIIGARPADTRRGWHNVATAASITGAARATLLHALHGARRPIYCDTDSIICEALGPDTKIHPTTLGAWKLELEADTFYIAAKKIYSAEHRGKFRDAEGVPLKSACKGAPVGPEIIARIAEGELYSAAIEAPSVRIGAPLKYITRTLARRA